MKKFLLLLTCGLLLAATTPTHAGGAGSWSNDGDYTRRPAPPEVPWWSWLISL